MPTPQQDTSSVASDASINAFMSLKEDEQRTALGKMSPAAKTALLAGVKSRQPKRVDNLPGRTLRLNTPPEETQPKEDQGVLAGVMGRVVDTVKAPYQAIDALTDPDQTRQHAIERGVAETYTQGARQTKEQFYDAARDPDPKNRFLKGLRGGVTAASLADPFATGSVLNLNQMQDEGRYKEAIGAAAFDALTLWAGKKTGAKPTTAEKINKLTSAIGETGETVKNLERTLPEIEQTAKQLGKPSTIGDFATNVRQSLTRLQDAFNRVFDPIKSRRAYTPIIKNHIDRILRENPNLMKTPEGQAEVAALRRVQRIYDKPWTLEDMNLERSRLRKEIRSLYDAKPTDAAAKLKLDAELKAKKVVADSFSETVNDHLAHVTGKPQSYYDILRQKQEALLDLNDHLDSQVEKLRDKQAAKSGQTVGERVKPHAYMSGAGPRVHVPFGEAVPAEGASDVASRKVRQAFGPTGGAKARRAAVLALPLSHLATAGEEVKKSRTKPPPQLDEEE